MRGSNELIALAALAGLAGCANYSDAFNPQLAAESHGCRYVEGHLKESLDYMRSGYHCPVGTPQGFLKGHRCFKVDGYRKPDKTQMPAYYLCAIDKPQNAPRWQNRK